MTRTPVLGVAAMGAIETAHIAHEVKNGKNFFEEAGKSAVTLATTLGATGILGAIGAKTSRTNRVVVRNRNWSDYWSINV